MTHSFRAFGIPKGQPRARACVRGRHAAMYDPGTADDWKTIVRNAALKQWNGPAFDAPVRIDLTFFFPRPKSHGKRNGELRENAPTWHTGKPDRDNLDKAVLDALVNACVLRDDSIVCLGTVSKVYVAPGEPPGLACYIETLT